MKGKRLILPLAVLAAAALALYFWLHLAHTVTLANREGTGVKGEEIQPLIGTVQVTGDQDTDVVFTDVETGEIFTIDYLTPGVPEKIRLERGKWYRVEGGGTLTVKPVNVRIE